MRKTLLFITGLALSFSLIACEGQKVDEKAPETQVEEAAAPDTTVADTTQGETPPPPPPE